MAGPSPFATQVVDIMSKDELITCFEDQDVEEAARMMREKQVRRLPVLSQDRRLVGIVSLGDLAVDTADPLRSGETLKEISRP
jgi:CBS domain-containing protein